MGLLREDKDLPENIEDSVPEVFAEPKEAAGLKENEDEKDDENLFVNRLMKDF